MEIKLLIEKLNLQPHPEGGYYSEIYRSEELIEQKNLPVRYNGNRAFCTSIYFALQNDQLSHLHRLKSDELWYYNSGSPFIIHTFDEKNGYKALHLGNNLEEGEYPQQIVPRGSWFAAELLDKSNSGLVSCVVSPGFDFADFELAERNNLKKIFPEHEELINRLSIR